MKLLGIEKIFIDHDKLRCSIVSESGISHNLVIELNPKTEIGEKILSEVELFNGKLLSIIEKEVLK